MAECDNIANNAHLFLRLRFAGESLVVENQTTAHKLAARLAGKVQNPA